MLISGGTGSGKTTLLNVLSGYIPPNERIVTIEDAAELQLQQPHVVRLETRPPNIEGNGEITQRALVRNALRMRPDRIIIGEVRGAEALDMLQAMNTGHEGSMTTIHANTAARRAGAAREHGRHGRPEPAAEGDARSRSPRPSRGVQVTPADRRHAQDRSASQEITGMEGDVITMQEIFTLPADRRRRRTARCRATSRPPACGRASPTGCARSASSCRTRCSTRPGVTTSPERGPDVLTMPRSDLSCLRCCCSSPLCSARRRSTCGGTRSHGAGSAAHGRAGCARCPRRPMAQDASVAAEAAHAGRVRLARRAASADGCRACAARSIACCCSRA